MRKLILFIIVFAIIVFVALPFVRATKPILELTPAVTTVGQATPIAVHVAHPKGVRQLKATIEQNGATYPLWELPQPSTEANSTFTFVAGAGTTPQLKDGKAQLIVEASSNGFPHKESRAQQEVTVITRPPSVTADSDQHYLYLGMADLATLSLSGTWTEAGVRVGDQTFRAWPMPGGKPGHFSLYAFPWNAPANAAPVAYASNGAANLVTSPLVFQFPPQDTRGFGGPARFVERLHAFFAALPRGP